MGWWAVQFRQPKSASLVLGHISASPFAMAMPVNGWMQQTCDPAASHECQHSLPSASKSICWCHLKHTHARARARQSPSMSLGQINLHQSTHSWNEFPIRPSLRNSYVLGNAGQTPVQLVQLLEPTGKLTYHVLNRNSLASFNQERKGKIFIMQCPASMNLTATNKSYSSMWTSSTSVPYSDMFTVIKMSSQLGPWGVYEDVLFVRPKFHKYGPWALFLGFFILFSPAFLHVQEILH